MIQGLKNFTVGLGGLTLYLPTLYLPEHGRRLPGFGR